MRILLVTYYLSPQKSVAADRPDSLLKYSRENGVDMDVLTVSCPGNAVSSPNIFRVGSILGWNRFPEIMYKLPSKIRTQFVSPFFFNIDYYWYNQALTHLKHTDIRSYDAVYAVYPQITALLIGRTIQKLWGVPMIPDFTDSMVFEPLDRPHPIQSMQRKKFEQDCFSHAPIVFTIAQGYANYYAQTYKHPNIYTIYNGFDSDDFRHIPLIPGARTAAVKRFVHFGSINYSRKRNVRPLFEGIARLRKHLGLLEREIEFALYGRYTEGEKTMVRDYGINNLVTFKGVVDRADGFGQIRDNYDCLLFYGVPGETSAVCSKLLEYLRLNKPIFGICQGNEAERIINRARAGVVTDFKADEVERNLLQAIKHGIDYDPDIAYINTFDRREQAREIFQNIREWLDRKS